MVCTDQVVATIIRHQFSKLQTAEDIADLLDVSAKRMTHLLYAKHGMELYRSFDVPKKSGGVRHILAPCGELKYMQQRLNQVLQSVYEPRAPVHGFVRDKSILTNAQMHCKKRYVLNLDIQDFYPSINFGRVRGLFMAAPYSLDPAAATILARLCCHENQLPQGAPTSPTVSNMICSKMDSELRRLAQRSRCRYTRYADDLTFSTNVARFPEALARHDDMGQLEIGDTLKKTITANGFTINRSKTRLQRKNERQEVTGLTVNRFPNCSRTYLRQVRAMLHAWRKYGYEAAEQEFHTKYDKHRNPLGRQASFEQVLIGKIAFVGMVRGKSDSYYRLFRRQLRELSPRVAELWPSDEDDEEIADSIVIVRTEGKSDVKHLRAALRQFQNEGSFQNLQLRLESDIGSPELLRYCQYASRSQSPHTRICVFDRDEKKIMNQVSENGQDLKAWDNQVFSLVIPIPDHRSENDPISIEMYYTDDEIVREDDNGRRLFLSTEFDEQSCRHKTEQLSCAEAQKAKRRPAVIIDNNVFNENHENVALPKDAFAQNVLDRKPNFDDFGFEGFRDLFELISELVHSN